MPLPKKLKSIQQKCKIWNSFTTELNQLQRVTNLAKSKIEMMYVKILRNNLKG